MYQDKTKCSKLPTRNNVIRIAREWIDTPFKHQAMVKGVGADCVGLVAGVGDELGILSDNFKMMTGYGRRPNPKIMEAELNKHLTPIKECDAVKGDIVWLHWRAGLPMHVAILSGRKGRKTLIHALSEARKVTEHTLTPDWCDRIVSFWRYPGLT